MLTINIVTPAHYSETLPSNRGARKKHIVASEWEPPGAKSRIGKETEAPVTGVVARGFI